MEESSSPSSTADHRFRRWWKAVPRPVRMMIVGAVGMIFILAGVAMLVLPGPGIASIAVGLVILGSEFAWAQQARRHGEHWVRDAWNRLRRRNGSPG